MQVGTGPVMIMGCSSNLAKNGNTYYNIDLYDANSGDLFRCSGALEVFNKVTAMQKPAQVKGVTLDVGRQYNGASRLELLGWQ